jgi:hypothetical protein
MNELDYQIADLSAKIISLREERKKTKDEQYIDSIPKKIDLAIKGMRPEHFNYRIESLVIDGESLIEYTDRILKHCHGWSCDVRFRERQNEVWESGGLYLDNLTYWMLFVDDKRLHGTKIRSLYKSGDWKIYYPKILLRLKAEYQNNKQ